MKATFKPVADHGLLVEFATEISDDASATVIALDRAIARAELAGITEVVPAFVNLLVLFDPVQLDHTTLQQQIEKLLPAPTVDQGQSKLHEIPICYDGDLGADLASVAATSALSVDAVIASHLASEYRVAMFGFAPGYAYMSGVPDVIQVPRKTAPVHGVAAGSVIIAGPQCLITTLEMPTGWSILGKSPTKILLAEPGGTVEDSARTVDAERDGLPPVLFEVGDRVRFTRIDLATFARMEAQS